MRAYVDKQGNPPSQQDIELIIDHPRLHISGDPRSAQQNATIDSQTRRHTSAAEIKQGRHRYLGRQIRAERIETFCEAVDRNLLQHNPDSGSSQSVVNNPFNYTICHVADEMEYRLSEELFCRMGGGSYYTGRGFNIAKAGSASSGDLGETNFRNGAEQWARTVSDNGDRRLVYGSAYAAIERTILDESEKIKRELDEEDEVLVEASFVV
ncbi:uncharacterized protein J4E79_002611 [Alternaria viburni]|uniref:uncharacterized protein n=1 Tax=Alternaria viburni TaxID=566460 RepID=UPI0020C1BDC7|nr:uncharacterized protein J4E79_002611 [Alternaria viburni]KAI4666572.1 hypothetical protein J4E79_002611 [Alternaria viburni]